MLKQIKEGHVKAERHNGVMTIEFSHPQSNSLPAEMLEGIAHEIHGAGNDHETKVVILQSAGERAFCAGASFDELLAIETVDQGLRFFGGFALLINEMRKCPKFIIVRIQGKCVGGGVGIAAAADYAIAVEGADVKLSELSIGIGPFVVGPAVERKIGLAAFSSLAIDAAMWRDAEWARRRGLYAELHGTVTGMDESIARLANQLAHSNPEAMTLLKQSMWKGTEHWDQLLFEKAALSGRLILSAFSKTAIQKFKKK
ncbi:enoyl-CoA hydratase/isomerase family protein [Puia dinghuensis]|uniref:Enoyl-CoA hydratase n=1 Tax=Puia dinghuensis TaxID=1792502 RepID=A0A8J2UFW1_9BACT|nr:enoyl-CoA hydratase/isomerase family protein [Puia dinghuensis]GGB11959.1 enoyl-CoA hydratase [Puia dinghuensis]